MEEILFFLGGVWGGGGGGAFKEFYIVEQWTPLGNYLFILDPI